MSFGFGFALPAYPLRGGGGNNPFNQSGPTLDLSFAGVVTDLSDPNGYTLNTNFITPQYQIAAQYVVWETGVGLVDKTFSQIITFTRASGATWFNSAGNLIGVDFSTSSNTIGTGSKTFTLTATAGVDRSWATGDSVLISDQSNSANNMTGTVTSYTASTQVLVVNVTSTGGSGTIASWRVGSTMPRLDYNPSTLAAQGFLVEEARTNSIRNNTMQGAVAGTPGTTPTNWTSASAGGISREVVGTGTVNGVNYIDLRVFGTTTNTNLALNLYFEIATQIAALTGQTWSESVWLQMVGGSTTGISQVYFAMTEISSGGADLAYLSGTNFLSTIGTFTRRTYTATTANASTAFLRPALWVAHTGIGAVIDITLRIGLPQLEQGAFATSVIPTTTTALTRSEDRASVNTLSPWFNATEGTIFCQGLTPPGAASFPSVGPGFSDGTTSNRMIQYLFTNGFYGSATTSGATQGNTNILTTPTVGAQYKFATAYANNDSQSALNGTASTVDNTYTVPAVNQMRINTNGTVSGNLPNSWIQRITYYPRRLSQAELVSVTA